MIVKLRLFCLFFLLVEFVEALSLLRSVEYPLGFQSNRKTFFESTFFAAFPRLVSLTALTTLKKPNSKFLSTVLRIVLFLPTLNDHTTYYYIDSHLKNIQWVGVGGTPIFVFYCILMAKIF